MSNRRAVMLGGALVLSAAALVAGDRVLVEAILVRVNDRIMTVSDFERRLRVELSQTATPPSRDELLRFARQLFSSAVDEMVLLERAEEKRLKVDDEMLDRAIAGLREENNLQDDRAFAEALKGAGLTEEQLRERYRHSMLMQRAAQSEVVPTEITEEELRRRYEADKERYRIPPRIELEQLFLPVAADGSDRSEVLRRARGLLDRVRAGNDLRAEATLAGVEVQELGAVPEADLRPDLQAALAGVGENQLTDPLETGGGIQIVRVVRRLPASHQPFDEVKEEIRRQLSLATYEQQTRGVVERLKAQYLVEIHEERLDLFLGELAGAA